MGEIERIVKGQRGGILTESDSKHIVLQGCELLLGTRTVNDDEEGNRKTVMSISDHHHHQNRQSEGPPSNGKKAARVPNDMRRGGTN
jgi:hypothetical protein